MFLEKNEFRDVSHFQESCITEYITVHWFSVNMVNIEFQELDITSTES